MIAIVCVLLAFMLGAFAEFVIGEWRFVKMSGQKWREFVGETEELRAQVDAARVRKGG